ncbi:diacylglycerol/lipid kinase family protein [Planosporangium flavigriseum]|uniref:Sphingosine kinase n=1 Tax=Planosporangium flavigriseum TaxID=373681 RepID=A0A8J3LRZ3_9ACTN|nr:diacylglycerol kinase family protein [Planosporangium flavigriseum]GIG75523.1 sphingosine kinase [Planosporangium flavigriseum]
MTATAEQVRTATRSAVVINPAKVTDLDGRRRDICAALAAAGWPEPLWLPTTPEDPGCGQTRQAISDGVSVVFACGGDGTVMACASELAGTDVALAVLPSGTGNLLATNLGLSSDVQAGVAVATGGRRRRIDVGVVGDRCFTVMAGMGFDAEMLAATPETLKKRVGWPAYVISALGRLRDRPMRVQIRLDDRRPIRRRARTVLVGNVGRLQGGVPLLPAAEPDDGCLDVAVLTPRTLRHWLSLAWGVLRRRRDVARMETFRARRVEITSDREQARELDGDVIEPGRSLTVTVRPGALCLCVPEDAPESGLG